MQRTFVNMFIWMWMLNSSLILSNLWFVHASIIIEYICHRIHILAPIFFLLLLFVSSIRAQHIMHLWYFKSNMKYNSLNNPYVDYYLQQTNASIQVSMIYVFFFFMISCYLQIICRYMLCSVRMWINNIFVSHTYTCVCVCVYDHAFQIYYYFRCASAAAYFSCAKDFLRWNVRIYRKQQNMRLRKPIA